MKPTIYQITTPRLILRCYHLNDAKKLNAAIVANLDHLRPFMPWAQGDRWKIEDRLEHITHWIMNFEMNSDYVFGIFSQDGKTLIGGTGLHKVAFDHYEMDRVEIHCSSLNQASARIPLKLGFEHEATLKRRYHTESGFADRYIFTLFRDKYPTLQIPALDIRAYDDEGRQYL
jgi:RimJ/RimL family protein N-acetyltransferase